MKNLILALLCLSTFHIFGQGYTVDWDITPFDPEPINGNYNKEIYAIGPKNIVFNYTPGDFINNSPVNQITNNGPAAKRIKLAHNINEDATFSWYFEDVQTKENFATSVRFNLHDLDENNEVAVYGKDENGNLVMPTYTPIQQVTYKYQNPPSGQAGHIIGKGIPAVGTQGSIKVNFSTNVSEVHIHMYTLGNVNDDTEIILDDIQATFNFQSTPPTNFIYESLNWDVVNYAPGSTAEGFPALNPNQVGFKVEVISGASDLTSTYPKDGVYFPPFDPYGSVECLASRSMPNVNKLTYEIRATETIENCHFRIGDIDNVVNGDFVSDQVTIYGVHNGKIVEPYIYSVVGGSSYHHTSVGQVATSQLEEDQIFSNFDRSVLNVYFPDPVDEITVEFKDIKIQPQFQAPLYLGISSIHYKRKEIPPFESEIEGFVFLDDNHNSIWDPTETGLVDVLVSLYKDDDLDGVADFFVMDRWTNEEGAYLFVVDEPGGYLITTQTFPAFYYIQTEDPDGFMDEQTHFSIGMLPHYIVKPFGYGVEGEQPFDYNGRSTTAAKIEISPNPASEFIDITANEEWENSKIELRDLQGKIITSSDLGSSLETRFNVGNLPGGLYVITLRKGENILSRKITIRK